MKLSSLISDGLVLQRDKKNSIWGTECSKDDVIKIIIDNKEVSTVADGDGRFCIELPDIAAGGPYEVDITQMRNNSVIDNVKLTNVMCGDVFLLCGQSNMEIPISRTLDMYEDMVKTMNNPDIHYYEVPKEHRFDKPSDDIYKGQWIAATNENICPMSALGLFFAQMREKDEKVPVGLIQTGVGGAHIEAFIDEDRIIDVGRLLRKKAEAKGEDISSCNCNKNDCCKVCYEKQIMQNKDASYVERTKEAEINDQNEWYRIVNEKDPGLKEHWEKKTSLFDDETAAQYVHCPGRFENLEDHSELEEVRGSIWLLKTVEIPKEWIDKEVRLYLGTLVDGDDTYVNGELVGQTGYRYPPRRYRIPSGVLHEGKNTIVIRLIANARAGGFVEEMPYYLSLDEEKISIDGEWQFKVGATINRGFDKEMEDVTFFNWKPAALYNQMLYPLKNLSLTGILFYQGESNATHAWEYEDLMVTLAETFRELFNENLPMGFIQLPMFGGEDEGRFTDDWDRLRDAQERASKRIDNSVLVDIYDLGFKYELHPQNKLEVAKRLYNAMKPLIS